MSLLIGVAHEGHAHIIERLGKYHRTKQSGVYFLLPGVDKVVYRWDLREQVMDIKPQKVITKDNTVIEVDAVVFYKIQDTHRASYKVSQLEPAIQNLTTSFIRAEMGSMVLRVLISKRDEINQNLLKEVDKATDSWGVKVTRVEIKNIELPGDLVQSMAAQRKSEIDADVRRILADSEREVKMTYALSLKETNIVNAEAKQQTDLLAAKTQKEAAILEAEQNREATRLESEGKLYLAKAEAVATERLSEAIKKGNAQAINYFIARDYVKALRDMASAKNHKVIMMPLEAGKVLGALGGISELIKEAFQDKSVLPQVAKSLDKAATDKLPSSAKATAEKTKADNASKGHRDGAPEPAAKQLPDAASPNYEHDTQDIKPHDQEKSDDFDRR